MEWCPPGKKKKQKILKFVDAGSNNWNERDKPQIYFSDKRIF